MKDLDDFFAKLDKKKQPKNKSKKSKKKDKLEESFTLVGGDALLCETVIEEHPVHVAKMEIMNIASN